LGVGCWVLGVGCWVLGVGRWALGIRNSGGFAGQAGVLGALGVTGALITVSPSLAPSRSKYAAGGVGVSR
jgi:hypothetical protein